MEEEVSVEEVGVGSRKLDPPGQRKMIVHACWCVLYQVVVDCWAA